MKDQKPNTNNTWTTLLGLEPSPAIRGMGPVTAAGTRGASGAAITRPVQPPDPSQLQLGHALKPARAVQPESDVDDHGLTPAEIDVLRLLVDGASNAEIAKRRRCSVGTVKVHLARIYHKLGVANRTQAVLIGERLVAIRNELIHDATENGFDPAWWMNHATTEQHGSGEVLFRAGDPADAMYYLQSGRVTIPELDVVLEGGAVFGEIGVFSAHRRRTATVRCDSPVRLFRVSARSARVLYVEKPKFALHVMRLVSQRLVDERLAKAA